MAFVTDRFLYRRLATPKHQVKGLSTILCTGKSAVDCYGLGVLELSKRVFPFVQVGVVFLFVLRDSVLVASSIQSHQGGSPNEGTFDVYIFFTALADSVWFAILLSVAAGFW